MNYRHRYHAGNFAEVLKHAVLALLIRRLTEKPTALRVIDTHAGLGRYDLYDAAAQRTGEYRLGIGRLVGEADPPAALRPYLEAVRRCNPQGGLRFYPGSPEIARLLLRPQDRLVLSELHPEDAAALAGAMAGDRRVRVHAQDGYLGLKAFLPPPERRGLVLLDPPFEGRDEFDRLSRGLRAGYRRWPNGVYAVWYPLKDAGAAAAFEAALAAAGIRRILVAQLAVTRPEPDRLTACAMAVINPPWRLDQELETLLPWLAGRLGQGPGAQGHTRWLVGE